jgi:hypothetical protein
MNIYAGGPRRVPPAPSEQPRDGRNYLVTTLRSLCTLLNNNAFTWSGPSGVLGLHPALVMSREPWWRSPNHSESVQKPSLVYGLASQWGTDLVPSMGLLSGETPRNPSVNAIVRAIRAPISPSNPLRYT